MSVRNDHDHPGGQRMTTRLHRHGSAPTKSDFRHGDLIRATELVGLPVLAIIEGSAIATVKDVLYLPERGGVVGFTLNRPGRFGGPLKQPLARSAVFAIGRDAITVADHTALGTDPDLAGAAREAGHRNVLGNQVLTETGARIGQVRNLIVAIGVVPEATGPAAGQPAATGWRAGDVVGYELAPARSGAPPRFLPLPYTLSVSGEFLMVPSTVAPFIREQLTALAAAVAAFRATLRPAGPADAPEPEATRPDLGGTP
jgi:sporulation protein YlmC with PRC-barrel domain